MSTVSPLRPASVTNEHRRNMLYRYLQAHADFGWEVKTEQLKAIACMGVNHDSLAWLDVFHPVRERLLREDLRWLRANRNGTYTVVPAAQQAETAVEDTRRQIARALAAEQVVVTCTDTGTLSTEEHRAHRALEDFARARRSSVRAAMRDAERRRKVLKP